MSCFLFIYFWQDVSQSKSTRKRKNSSNSSAFKESFKINRPWLVCKIEKTHHDISYESMYCKLCQKWNTSGANCSMVWNKTGCMSMRLDVIKNHESSRMHKTAVELELTGQHNFEKNC